jgi:hypothetical protein
LNNTGAIDVCTQCNVLDAYKGGTFAAYPIVCTDDKEVAPFTADICSSNQFITEYYNTNQCHALTADQCASDGFSSKGRLKCQDHTVCAVGAQKEIAQSSSQWDRICECDKDLLVGASAVTCAADSDGTITAPVSVESCVDGFVILQRACSGAFSDKNCNICIFDFTYIPVSSAQRCTFKSLTELFDFSYKITEAHHDLSLGNDLAVLRSQRKTLLTVSLDLTITNFDAPSYEFKQWDSVNGNWIPVTKTTTTHKHCYIKPSFNLTNGNYVADPLTSSDYDGCDSHESVNLFADIDAEVALGTKSWDSLATDNTFYDANGYTIELDTYSVIAAHKLIGVASLCGTDDADDVSHEVFAWSDLRGSGSESITIEFTPANIQADQSSGVTMSNVYSVAYGIDAQSVIPVTELLYIHGLQPTDISAATGTVGDGVSFQIGSSSSSNAVQHSGAYKATGELEITCGATLTISSNDDNFHCFDIKSDASFPPAMGTDAAFSETYVHEACTTQLISTCSVAEKTAFKIEDSRKCYNTANPAECNLLIKADGTNWDQPSEADISNEISVKMVIIEAIRLGNSRKFPKTSSEVLASAVTADDFDSVGDPIQAFICDTVTCDTDPYLVRHRSENQFDIGVDWDGDALTTEYNNTIGCLDPISSLSSKCLAPTVISATVTGVTGNNPSVLDSGILPLLLPGANYPQFYVYGLVTYADTNDIFSENINSGRRNSGRRLGAPHHLQTVEKKTIVVVAVKHVAT